MGNPAVVIVGGGFGGLAAARTLVDKPVDVLLIDERNYHLFTPLLYQVATALLNPSDIAYPLRARFRRARNVRFYQARVGDIEFDANVIGTSGGDRIPYDYLILASGSVGDYFGNDEVRAKTLGLKTLEDALQLRNHVLSALELATREPDEDERRRLLTFVIAGGGPTGVEYAGALSELLRLVLGRDYPMLAPGSAHVVLVEGRDRLLEALPEHLGRYAERTLLRLGVEVRLNALLEDATEAAARMSSGEEIPTRTVVWTAGVRPQAPALDRDIAQSRSRRLVVDDRLRIPGTRGVFAIGDAASIRYGDSELPMLSAPAMQAGRYVARQIIHEVKESRNGNGRSPRFSYVDKGVMATIGRHAAVGRLGRLTFTGFPGWLMWLVVHLYYLVGFRNRFAVFALWGWNYFRKDRPIRIIAPANPDPLVARVGRRTAGPFAGPPGEHRPETSRSP
jgi:NADH:ubiquinone reductase (H+-translocating)